MPDSSVENEDLSAKWDLQNITKPASWDAIVQWEPLCGGGFFFFYKACFKKAQI